MNATQEMVVSGENLIERRIILFPQQEEIEDLQTRAFSQGYKRGWTRGLLMGLAIVGVAALCILFAVV